MVAESGEMSVGRRAFMLAATTMALSACREESVEAGREATLALETRRFPGGPGVGRTYVGVSLAVREAASERPELGGQRLGMSRRFYRHWQPRLLQGMAAQDLESGILPFMSIKTPGSWSEVANGSADAWTLPLLEGLASLDAPVWLAVHHEPENDRGSHGSPEDWRRMQAYVAKRAGEVCPKVTVVPVLMAWTFSRESGRDPRAWLVDDTPLQGVDAYNLWEPYTRKEWSDFGDLIADVRRFVPDLPLVAPECGSVSDPEDRTSAGRWLSDAFTVALEEDVVGMAWFNSEHNNRGGQLRLDPYGEEVLRTLVERPRAAHLRG